MEDREWWALEDKERVEHSRITKKGGALEDKERLGHWSLKKVGIGG